jgi:hypothetical protein
MQEAPVRPARQAAWAVLAQQGRLVRFAAWDALAQQALLVRPAARAAERRCLAPAARVAAEAAPAPAQGLPESREQVSPGLPVSH